MGTDPAGRVILSIVMAALVVAAFTIGQNVGAGGSPIMGDGSVSCDVYEDGSAVCEFEPGREWAEHGGTLSGCLTPPEWRRPYLCSD